MKVYTTPGLITRAVIGEAARKAGCQFQDTRSREGWFQPIREFRARDGRDGFEFFLSGSSSHRAQHDREEYAATWTEWGIVIDALFDIDPDAKIGHYNGREEFFRITSQAYGRSGEETPWLD